VWDGQTVLIENGLAVRYLGIHAPGGGVLGRPLEHLGREAAVRNLELVEGKEIELEQDTTSVDADGRLPRYVYVDGQLVNDALVRAGLAQVAARPPDVRYREQLLEAEREAYEGRRGLWTGAPTMTPTARPVAPTRPPAPAVPVAATATPEASRAGVPTLGVGAATVAPTVPSTRPPATVAAPVLSPAPAAPVPSPPAAATAAPVVPRFGE
jgi:endonuclease YncB( thermonuclease family)